MLWSGVEFYVVLCCWAVVLCTCVQVVCILDFELVMLMLVSSMYIFKNIYLYKYTFNIFYYLINSSICIMIEKSMRFKSIVHGFDKVQHRLCIA